MFNLEPFCTIREVAAYVDLCREYKIKQVFVGPDVFQRIEELRSHKYSYIIFQNVKFIQR